MHRGRVPTVDLKQSERRRDPDPSWRPYLVKLKAAFDEHYPRTIEEWEDGFCRDLHPEQEIAIWLVMVEKYERALKRRTFTPAERNDIFRMVLSQGTGNAPLAILAVVKSLTASEADVILREDIGA